MAKKKQSEPCSEPPTIVDELTQQPLIASVVDTDRQIARLQAQNQILKSKYDHACVELELAEQRLEFATALAGATGTPKPLKRLKAEPGGDSTAILVLTDIHAEERVDADTVNGLNEYNLTIAEQRIQSVFRKAVLLLEWSRKFADIQELTLALLGDLISGYIHEELEESNFLSPTEACLFVQDQIHTGIAFLLKEADVKRIIVPTTHGNHGRVQQKKRISTAYKNSYEWMLYNQMARHYANEPRVEWKIEKGIHNWLTIQDRDVRFHHGDSIHYHGGVGGITIPANKKIAQWNKSRRADLDIWGHFHCFMECWNWVSSGCLIGYNSYAMSIGADFQPPSQTFIIVSKKYGKVLAMPVFPTE